MITGDQTAIARETCRELDMGSLIYNAEILNPESETAKVSTATSSCGGTKHAHLRGMFGLLREKLLLTGDLHRRTQSHRFRQRPYLLPGFVARPRARVVRRAALRARA